MKKKYLLLLLYFLKSFVLPAQHKNHQTTSNLHETIEAQPLLAQALRLSEALSFPGNALANQDIKRLKDLNDKDLDIETVKAIQEILDPYCLNTIRINPEGRVKVDRGLAQATLIQGGWTSFLVKINNDAGITAKLEAESPNAAKPYHSPSFEPNVKKENVLTPGQVANRFVEIQMYSNRPLQPNLSGLKLEYAVVQIYSKDAGQREIAIGYNVGHGSQDITYRNVTPILFLIKPSVNVKFHVKDEDGSPVMASFLITGSQEYASGKFTGIYPLPSRRVASADPYPDFFFQPQIYRNDGETVQLPPGKYSITYTRGPEYLKQTTQVTIR